MMLGQLLWRFYIPQSINNQITDLSYSHETAADGEFVSGAAAEAASGRGQAGPDNQ